MRVRVWRSDGFNGAANLVSRKAAREMAWIEPGLVLQRGRELGVAERSLRDALDEASA